jgi:hypothetical protein
VYVRFYQIGNIIVPVLLIVSQKKFVMNPKDRHLDIPSEANRDKHINFAAIENNDEDPADLPAVGDLAAEGSRAGQAEQTYDFLVDGVDYFVRVLPFTYNDETRYYISVNDGPRHVFVWDEQLVQIRSLDDSAAILPDTLETAISRKLISSR